MPLKAEVASGYKTSHEGRGLKGWESLGYNSTVTQNRQVGLGAVNSRHPLSRSRAWLSGSVLPLLTRVSILVPDPHVDNLPECLMSLKTSEPATLMELPSREEGQGGCGWFPPMRGSSTSWEASSLEFYLRVSRTAHEPGVGGRLFCVATPCFPSPGSPPPAQQQYFRRTQVGT